jgi:hypothetical protein
MTAPLIRVGWVLYGHQFLLLERLFLIRSTRTTGGVILSRLPLMPII